ncbi:MAG: BatD family protein [bacterium]
MKNQGSRSLIRVFLLMGIFCLVWTPSALADFEVSIMADKTNVIPGEQVSVVISVRGAKNASEPEFPKSDAYEVYSRGKSSRFELVNGAFSASLDFNYVLIPLKKQDIIIPGITVRSGKVIRQTEPLVIRVSSDDSQTLESERPLFATSSVDEQEPFVNQQIIYTLQLFQRIQIQGARMDPLEFDGFHAKRLGKEKESTRMIKGKQYHVTEIRFALFPQRSGILTIQPARLQCQVLYQRNRGRSSLDRFFDDPFFGGFGRGELKTEFLSTEPIQVHVKPLPEPDNPDLVTPLVGQYSITTSLSQQEIKVGDSATMSISIMGRGNVHDIPEPTMPDIPDFKIYEDKPEIDLKMTPDGISGVKTFKKALVPTKPGEYKIPPIRLPFLDPNTGTYRMASGRSLSISVLPGTEEESLHLMEGERHTVKKEEIKLLGKDILPPKTTLSALKDQSMRWSNPVSLILLLIPPLTFFVFFFWKKKKEHMSIDQAYYRRKNAVKIWRKRGKEIMSMVDSDPNEFYNQTSRSLKQFLGDRLMVSGQALTPHEINQKMGETGIPEDLRIHLQQILQTLEKGAFCGLYQNTEERKSLFKDLEKVVSKLLRWI